MVINNKANMVKTIVQIPVKELNFLLTKEFLTGLTKQGLGNGVARDEYYIINVNGILRVPAPPPVGEYKLFTKLLEACQQKGFTYIMLITK